MWYAKADCGYLNMAAKRLNVSCIMLVYYFASFLVNYRYPLF
jgi:hypothetical protein